MQSDHENRLPQEIVALKRVGKNEWTFVFPRLTSNIMEQFHEAIELWETEHLSQAERRYRQLLLDYPEFIDVYHHLAMLLDETDRYPEAFQLWQRAVDIGLNCFPRSFSIGRDLLPWAVLDNRPFLRAYHGLGLVIFEQGGVENALSIFTDILAMNPNDNQGVRGIAINCSFCLRRPWDVLDISERYPQDMMTDVVYGRVLALYQQGRNDDAEMALREAMDFLPLVAKELVKDRHRRPRKYCPGFVAIGSADEAYDYWIEHGKHWRKTSGAIDFVKGYMQRNTR